MDTRGRNISKRPQFVLQLKSEFLEKLPLPCKFVQQHLQVANCQEASLFSPLGKFWLIKLNRNGQQVYFDKLWDKFVQFHGLVEGYSLLFRYEGNMVFSVKVFDLYGCLKEYNKIKRSYTSEQVQQSEQQEQNTDSDCIDLDNQCENCAPEPKKMRPEMSNNSSQVRTRSVTVRLALPSITSEAPKFKKKIAPYEMKKKFIRMPKSFCIANKFQRGSLIILKDMHDRESHIFLKPMGGVYVLGTGMEKFMTENNAKAGDIFACELRSTGVIRGWIIKE